MSDLALRFRAATLADVDAIVALTESAYRGDASRAGWTTEADLLEGQRTDADEVAAWIGKPETRIVLAERVVPAAAVQLLASCVIEHLQDGYAGDAYFGMFSVRPGAQGHGVGGALLAEAEHLARDTWRCTHIRMTVIDVRGELIAWYQRHGYQRTGEYKPFPYGNARFGVPKRDDLRFEWLVKDL